MSPGRYLLALLLAICVAASSAQRVQLDAPVANFRLPFFSNEGRRTALIRGTEGRISNKDLIEVKELNLALFANDSSNRVETIILSPAASVVPNEQKIQGKSSLRVVNDDFEITGDNWVYSHREKAVSLAHNVHVVFHEQLNALIK